ncbi:MAG: hypothetical protein R3C61_02430 [Bacteroidia bacterium]
MYANFRISEMGTNRYIQSKQNREPVWRDHGGCANSTRLKSSIPGQTFLPSAIKKIEMESLNSSLTGIGTPYPVSETRVN